MSVEAQAKVSISTTPQSPLKLPHNFFYTKSKRVFHAPTSVHIQNLVVICQPDLWGWLAGCSGHEPGVLTIGCSIDKWVLSEPIQPRTTFFSYLCQSNWVAKVALKKLGQPHPCFGNISGPLKKKNKKHHHLWNLSWIQPHRTNTKKNHHLKTVNHCYAKSNLTQPSHHHYLCYVNIH